MKDANYYKSLPAVRETCTEVLKGCLKEKEEDGSPSFGSTNWKVNLDKIPTVVDEVLKTAEINYPGIPLNELPYHSRWRHFEACNIDRLKEFESGKGWSKNNKNADKLEILRKKIDLVIVSVLLDAGAGSKWKYTENKGKENEIIIGRSEGLGVASWHMFLSGAFSSDKENPHQADNIALCKINEKIVGDAFQVTEENSLIGLKGRSDLLVRLGSVLKNNPTFFQKDGIVDKANEGDVLRPGYLVDYLLRIEKSRKLTIHDLWKVVSFGLSDIWPKDRIIMDGLNLGDAWNISHKDHEHLVVFHKLSQWLTYSLLEPLEKYGFEFSGASQHMTGLPEYRNGGLLVDSGVLEPRDSSVLTSPGFAPGSGLIVEWRALTVALLDRIATALREKLNFSENDLPLAKILEAGTWATGRRYAFARIASGEPPIKTISDGTVF